MKKSFVTSDSILWHDGMMLTARHFQRLTDRMEELAIYHSSLSSPYNWGIRTLKIDKDLLTHGKLLIHEIEAVMPDGLVIHDSKNNRNQLELDLLAKLDLSKQDRQKTYRIYLYVPSKEGSVFPESENRPRYKQVQPEIIEDESVIEQESSIPYQIPNASLLFSNDHPDQFPSIPLLEINYENGQFNLLDYIPPMLTVESFSDLGKIITSIVQKVRMKALFISRQISPTAVQYEPAILDKRILMQNLIAGLPILEIQLQAGVYHPNTIYLSLCNLLGNLTPLGFDQMPPSIIPYDHNNLRDTFSRLKDIVFQILDESIGESFHAVPFEKTGNIFSLRMNKYWLTSPIIIGIEPKEGKSETAILEWILNCLIGNDYDLVKMRRERTLGAQRFRIDKDTNFPPTMDSLYFKVEQESIKPDMELKIFNPSDKPGAVIVEKINLYIRRRAE